MALSCPKFLTGIARTEWKRVCKEVEFQASDYATLLSYVEAFARYRRISAQLETEGLTITENVFGRSGNLVGTRIARNPNLITLKDERAALLRAAYLLGLNEVRDAEIEDFAE